MDQNLHLKLVIRNLTIVGFWPLKINNKFLKTIYSFLYIVTMTFYILIVTSEVIELFIVLKDVEQVSLQLSVVSFHLLGLAKINVLSSKTVEKLKLKIMKIEKNIMENASESIKKIYLRNVELNEIADKMIIYVGLFCYILFNVTPYFTDRLNRPNPLFEAINNKTIVYKPRPLPLPTWFPFDRYKYYWTSYILHVIALTFIAPCTVGLYIFFYGLIIFAVGQLKILQSSLTDFKKNIGDERDHNLINIRRCIAHHKSIILYIAELSNAMKVFLLFDFIGCGLQIAVIGFQAAVMEFSPNFIKTVWYLLTMLTQLFLFYWFANEALLESINVANAVWNSDWYTCDESTKRTLLIIMMRAQKPLILSVGSFYHMSTETLISIIRVGYSYSMLMQRVYRK